MNPPKNKRKLTVPLCVHSKDNLQTCLADLRQAGAERIFLIDIPRLTDAERFEKAMETLRDYVIFFKGHGFEVGVWLNAFGFGTPLTKQQKRITSGFTPIRSIRGAIAGDAFCPADDAFADYYLWTIGKLAELPVDLIMLDDDYCLSIRPGIGCACDKHLDAYRKRIGIPEFKREDFDGFLFGEKKVLRRAWFDLQGETLIDFARKVRARINEKNPSIRCGFCAGYTSWDFEGVDALTLTKLLAGDTKPFLRLTGAPYWVASNRGDLHLKVQDIVELTRMQRAWCADAGVEIFDENDNFPRLSTNIPYAYSEGFDLAMCVDGQVPPFKYLMQYHSSLRLERTYLEAHVRNLPAVEAIARCCTDKRDIGVRIYEYADKIRDYDFDPSVADRFGRDSYVQKTLFSRAHCFASRIGIPTVYGEASPVGILCGENAKYIPLNEIPRGLILDIRAAELLRMRGVDVGLVSSTPYEQPSLDFERIGSDKVQLLGRARRYTARIAKEAEILSRCANELSDTEQIFSYRYENRDGHRFLVYCFDANSVDFAANEFSHYERKKQVETQLPWLGLSLPFRCEGNLSNLYVMCKRAENGTLFLALFNFTPDARFDLPVTLWEGLRHGTLCPVKGQFRPTAEGLLLEQLPAFDYAAVELKTT